MDIIARISAITKILETEAAAMAPTANELAAVRACIIVNAVRLGCTHEEAEAYAYGTAETSFVDLLLKKFADRELPQVKAAEELAEAVEKAAERMQGLRIEEWPIFVRQRKALASYRTATGRGE